MTQEGNTFGVSIVATATATHPPGTIVHPDGTLTAPEPDPEPDGAEQIEDDELDDNEGQDRP